MSTILPSTYNEGTISVAALGTVVTGVGTTWVNTILPGDFFSTPSGLSVRILEVTDNTHLTLAYPWPGPAVTTGAYEIRFQADMARMQETSRQLLQKLMNGNIDAFAGLTGAADAIPMFTGPGAMTLISRTDLVNGVNFDVAVDELADRAAYDTQAAGYTVLVADNGDGRAAIYFKNSNASGDWSNAAYVTGAKGDTGLNWQGNWSNATAYAVDDAVFYNNSSWIALVANTNVAPVAGATWGQLAARGAQGAPGTNGSIYIARGTYSGATAYAKDDTVLYNGSTFVALQATTGNAPPTLPTTSNTWWQLVAQKGTDGSGTGDVVGPAGATDWDLVFFNGTTGKLLRAATIKEALDAFRLGPVFGGPPPEPSGAGVGLTSGDFDTINYAGIYTVAGTWTNGPNGSAGSAYTAILEVRTRRFTNFYVQYFYQGDTVFRRWTSTAGGLSGWSTWRQVDLSVGTTAGTVAAGDDPRFGQGGKNDALLALEIADLKGSRMGMAGGIADAFDDETGVNTGGSTNQAYDAANDWYAPVTTSSTVFSRAISGSDGLAGYTVRTRIKAGQISSSGSKIRLNFQISGAGVLQKMYVGYPAATGDAYDFVAAPTQVTFDGGSPSHTFSAAGSVASDIMNFALDNTKDLLISWYVTGSGNAINASSSNVDSYHKSGDDAATVDATGYTSSANYSRGIASVETGFSTSNMTLVSAAYTAASVPSTARVALQLVEPVAITINTDVTAEVSRDGGTTWTAVTLALSTNLNGVKVYEGTATISGQPSGTSMRWRVKTLNNKNVDVSGVVLQWS